MTTAAKKQIIDAIESTIVQGGAYSVISRLTRNDLDTEKTMNDATLRAKLAKPVIIYVQALSEADAKQIVDTVVQNPEAIHALFDELSQSELLATAAVFLHRGIGKLEDYTPNAKTILQRAEKGESGLIPTMDDLRLAEE